MSKERLEELEKKYSTITITRERDEIEYAEIDVRDLIYLIQYGFRQTERVQELEKARKTLSDNHFQQIEQHKYLLQQNKHYREAKDELDAIFHEKHKPYPSEYEDGYLDGLDRAIGIIEKSLEESK